MDLEMKILSNSRNTETQIPGNRLKNRGNMKK